MADISARLSTHHGRDDRGDRGSGEEAKGEVNHPLGCLLMHLVPSLTPHLKDLAIITPVQSLRENRWEKIMEKIWLTVELLSGSAGADELWGGDGNDVANSASSLTAPDAGDVINGEAGNDKLHNNHR